MNVKKLAFAIGATTIASAAFATVTINASGVGFVGKGDVQLAFGWNNATLQRNAVGVSFAYKTMEKYDVGCYWETTTGNGHIVVHDITVPKNIGVNSTVAYDARMRTQITGFNLNGFSSSVSSGTVPAVGDACPGNNQGTVTDVTLTSSTSGLFVNYGDLSVELPITPPAL